MSEAIETNDSTDTSTESTQTASVDSEQVTEIQETSDSSEQDSQADTSESTQEAQDEPLSVTEEKTLGFQEKFSDQLRAYLEGDISEDDYKAIEKLGTTRGDFELMASALKMQQEKNTKDLMDSVGGPEVYSELQKFAVQNLSVEEQEAVNKALFSDLTLGKLVAQGIKARMNETNGYGPLMKIEATPTRTEAPMFNTRDELVDALTSHKYRTDPEYRQEVNNSRLKSGW